MSYLSALDVGMPVREALWETRSPEPNALTAAVSEQAAALIGRGDMPIEETVSAAAKTVRRRMRAVPRNSYKNRALIEGSIPPERSLSPVASSYVPRDIADQDEPYGEDFVAFEGLSGTSSGWGLGLLLVAGAAVYFWWQQKNKQRP
jgi:hypothetical protein